MHLTVSKGNTKLGAVPNISLTPGESCVDDVPCLTEGCYAMKSYRMYPNVRAAWDGNLRLWKDSPGLFFDGVDQYLLTNKPDRFRWHVGGDIPDEDYFEMMVDIAWNFRQTSFLCFTKKYNLVEYGRKKNLHIVLSAWPGMDFPVNSGFPEAWLATDPRAPLDKVHIRCPGNCGDCQYKCWYALTDGVNVIFDKH